GGRLSHPGGDPLTAQAVADLVGGRLCGAGELVLRRVRSLELAGSDDLSVCSGSRWLPALARTRAGAVLLPEELAESPGPATRIVVEDPMKSVAMVAAGLYPARPGPGVDATARIGAGAVIGAGCCVEAYAVIGAGAVVGDETIVGAQSVIGERAVIGPQCVIGPRVVVEREVTIGARVRVKSGAVIGGDGFGFISSVHGHDRVPQTGGCIIGDDVEIGSCTCIDRGSLDDTVIGAGTKIDNLVHIAHNVHLGRHCLVMMGVGVSGSTRVGDGVVLAGQAGLVGHIEIGDGARIGAQAGVIASVPAGATVSGYPARPHRDYLRAQAALFRLAEHVDALEELARKAEDAET
ncbi:MAG TPA: UDP-3-O-(3-hydroxymyristoyl)glucosamine N-acyltransferase, partial [Gemmatimonadales bacterium]|nr:UDP-3-O-(3-hydroxymyristoyl)glucosamine N-acyltransferase [Gemmatimonadales bacterium]